MLNAELLKSIDAYIKLNYVETTEANKAVKAQLFSESKRQKLCIGKGNG